jgi:hypothetical protein
MRVVFPGSNQLEIVWAIVLTVFVAVVDVLRNKQRPPHFCGHDYPTATHVASAPNDRNVGEKSMWANTNANIPVLPF